MSLDQPSRLSAWPRIVARIVLILAVFAGVNWWVTNQQTQQHQQISQTQQTIEETITLPAVQLQDGIAIVFVWDVSKGGQGLSQQVRSPQELTAWRDVAAASLYKQFQRLTRHAGQHSDVRLRVALIVIGQKSSQNQNEDQPTPPLVLLTIDAPSANEQIKEMLVDVKPGGVVDFLESMNTTTRLLHEAALRDKHVILLMPKHDIVSGKITANKTKSTDNDNPTTYHIVLAPEGAARIDHYLNEALDTILTPAPLTTQPTTQPAAQATTQPTN